MLEPLALGFDIGGTYTKLGLVDASGKIYHFRKFPTDAQGSDPGPFQNRLFENIDALLKEAGQEVIGIGMSVHGYANEDRTRPILSFNTPALEGIDLTGMIEAEFKLPTVLNNDLTTHVLAEYTFGSGRQARRFLCLAMGTGLGAGVIINGKPLRYVGGCAGDTGHIILEPGGPSCAEGCRGCAEALCGVAGIERLAEEKYGHPVKAHEVIRSASTGDDPIAAQVMTQIGYYLGQTLASLAAIFLPERIALTGGTANAGAVLLDATKERFEELAGEYHRNFARVGGDYYNGVEIVFGTMRGETGVVGAVVELLEPYLKDK